VRPFVLLAHRGGRPNDERRDAADCPARIAASRACRGLLDHVADHAIRAAIAAEASRRGLSGALLAVADSLDPLANVGLA
jgi:hypothetical protein